MNQRPQEGSPEIGLSHVALSVRDVEASVAFYSRYAGMREVHRRETRSGPVVWLSDLSRPFVIVLIEVEEVDARLEGIAHLGIGCRSREAVDELCALASRDACLQLGPEDAGQPVGYWALLRDPDGHNLELSFGQQVAIAVDEAESTRNPGKRRARATPPGTAPTA